MGVDLPSKFASLPFRRTLSRIETMYLVDTVAFRMDPSQVFAIAGSIVADAFSAALENFRASMGEMGQQQRAFIDGMELALGTLTGALASRVGVYKFRISPDRFTRKKRKNTNLVDYGMGYMDVTQYGDRPATISISGTTGTLKPPRSLSLLGLTDVRLSLPYLKMKELEFFWNKAGQELLIYWLGDIYYGWFEDFSYDWSANGPDRISYNITFSTHPYAQGGLYFQNLSKVYGYETPTIQDYIRSTHRSTLETLPSWLQYTDQTLNGGGFS